MDIDAVIPTFQATAEDIARTNGFIAAANYLRTQSNQRKRISQLPFQQQQIQREEAEEAARRDNAARQQRQQQHVEQSGSNDDNNEGEESEIIF